MAAALAARRVGGMINQGRDPDVRRASGRDRAADRSVDRAAEVPADSTGPSASRALKARATMSALAASPDVFETFFEQARIGLALADLSTRYVRVNQTYADLLGRPPEDLIGVPFAEIMQADPHVDGGRMAALLAGERDTHSEERQYGTGAGAAWVLHGITVVPGPDGRPAWFAVSAQDITERRRAEERLAALTAFMAHTAVRDPLTGLANRSLLVERLRAALARDARAGTSSGLLFLDLDGFKQVNDLHGHSAGDAVLCSVAERLRRAVRPSDTVARLGGDEFVVLVEGAEEPALDALAKRLSVAVTEPLLLRGLSLNVGVSIGKALSRHGVADPSQLLAAADQQMYAAKRQARD